MTLFVDTYLKSKNREALEALRGYLINVTDVVQGRAAIQSEDENGELIETPAAGDPAYFYTCVRSAFPIPAFDDVSVCSQEEALPLVGIWA